MNTHEQQTDDGFRLRPARTIESLRRQQAAKLAVITETLGLPPVSIDGMNPKSSPVYKRHRGGRVTATVARVGITVSDAKWAGLKKPILCVETDTLYPSTRDAATAIGVTYQAVYRAIVRGKTCGGQHWRRPTQSDFARIAVKAAS